MYGFLVFIYGLIFGSFFNVVALRGLSGEKLTGFSHCPKCGMRLRAKNLVPVLSFLFQKGKCSNCGCKIDLIYPIFELSTAISYLLLYTFYGISLKFVILVVLISALIISTLTDLKEAWVLDRVVIISFLIILALRIADPVNIFIHVVSSITLLVIFFVMSGFDKIGGGDAKLIAIMCLAMGLYNTILAITIASVVCLIYTVMFAFVYKMKVKSIVIRFVPFLLVGTIICQILINSIFTYWL